MLEIASASPVLPRRTALKAGLALGFAGLALPTVNACTSKDRPDRLTVAGGEPGGFYLEFATLLAGSLQRHGIADDVTPLTTGGSLENLERLAKGEATLAVALSDAAAQKVAGEGSSAAGGSTIVALAKVYENYVHCIVRKDSRIGSVAGLAGKKVATGEPRSGTSLIAQRLISAAGLGSAGGTGQAVTEVNLGLNAGLAALKAGSVDALFWSGGVPTAAIAAANQEVSLGLLDLSSLIPAARAQYGAFYDRVLIPENSYEGTVATWTVGVSNLLLCRNDLDDGTVTRTIELLVNHAQELIPQSSLGVQFLSPETLINTAGLPLHPAAKTAYRRLHG